MLQRSIIFAAAVCGFAVLAVPMGNDKGEDAPAKAQSAIVPPFSASSNKTFATKSGGDGFGGEHTLLRERDGHFYANASIDGARMRMLVDTGASVIALTGRDANAAGVYWDENDVRHIGQGASGAVYGVSVRLDEVEIGGMTRRNVDAVVIPEGLDISLLGQSYLAQIGTVEIADDKMTMRAR